MKSSAEGTGRTPDNNIIQISIGQHNPKKTRRKVSPSELPFSPQPVDSGRADKSPGKAAPVPQVPKPPLRDKRKNPQKLP